MKNEDAYAAITAAAARTGWPEIYQEDLTVHDRDLICGDGEDNVPQGAQFAWLVRATGTWVITDEADTVLSYCEDYDPHRAFWWDGTRLTEIPLAAVRINLQVAR